VHILPDNTRIDFMRLRYLAVGFSAALMVLSLTSIFVRGLNFGIDFTGGTLIEVAFADPVDVGAVRASLDEASLDGAQVQYYGTARDILVRLPVIEEKTSAVQGDEVMAALRKPFAEVVNPDGVPEGAQTCIRGGKVSPCAVQMRRVEFVGPQVGQELVQQGGLAMLYAIAGILLYVIVRFEWRLAAGAVAALVHDALVTVGVFSVFQLEFSLSELAAVLAVIGYSLNDTIVVFDRIRENFRRMRKEAVSEIMNISINQVLPRTILTSLTTLIVLVALFLLGGSVIHGFALALIVGIVTGTYSTIYVASALAMWLGLSRDDLTPVRKEQAEVDRMP